MNDLLNSFLLVCISLLLFGCISENSFVFKQKRIKVLIPSCSSKCILSCENSFEDYSSPDWCFKDTCKQYVIMISYHDDTTVLSKFVNYELDKLNSEEEEISFIEVEKKLTNEEYLRKSLWYELDTKPYMLSGIKLNYMKQRTNYLNYSILGVDKTGSYHITIRKEIDSMDLINDLNWQNDFNEVRVDFD